LNTHEYSSKIYALSIGYDGDGSLNFNATMAPKRNPIIKQMKTTFILGAMG
jgi:hypothetical protein